MPQDLNSGTVGGFGHMGENDPYNDGGGYSGSTGNAGNHDVSSDMSSMPTFGTLGKHPVTLYGSKDIPQNDLTNVVNNLIIHEGALNTMYVDTQGHVTVGIGHMLESAAAGYNLGFTKTHHISRGHGDSEDVEETASHSDIDAAFNAAKTHTYSNVHLSDQKMLADCVNRVEADRAALRAEYSNFDHFPQSAKTALHDMAYNLGMGNLKSKFPNFNAAVNRQDWATAAAESHRVGIGDGRNKDTYDQFMNAASGH